MNLHEVVKNLKEIQAQFSADSVEPEGDDWLEAVTESIKFLNVKAKLKTGENLEQKIMYAIENLTEKLDNEELIHSYENLIGELKERILMYREEMD